MRRIAFLLTVAAAVAACSNSRPDIVPNQEHFPPLGLASTARWLDVREANTSRAPTAQEIPTSQIREVVAGGTPVAPSPVASVPARAAPSGTVALAAQAFADTCVASLPDMNGVEDRFAQINQRDFGIPPAEAARGYFLGGQRRGDIFMNVSIGAGRNNVFQCLSSVSNQDPATVAQAMVNTLTNAGFALTPVSPSGNAQQAWSISGAKAGTQLKTSTRTNARGKTATGVWITWR